LRSKGHSLYTQRVGHGAVSEIVLPLDVGQNAPSSSGELEMADSQSPSILDMKCLDIHRIIAGYSRALFPVFMNVTYLQSLYISLAFDLLNMLSSLRPSNFRVYLTLLDDQISKVTLPQLHVHLTFSN